MSWNDLDFLKIFCSKYDRRRKACNHCTLFPADNFYGKAKHGAERLRALRLFQLFTILKGVADFLAKDEVVVMHRVEGNWAQFLRVDLSLAVQNALVGGDIHDLTQ